jgi:hypothetical protein
MLGIALAVNRCVWGSIPCRATQIDDEVTIL